MLRGLKAKGMKLINFKMDTKCTEIIQITAPWSSDQFWTFRPSETGCPQSETSAWCLGRKEGEEEVGVGRNQRAETYCFNLKRS